MTRLNAANNAQALLVEDITAAATSFYVDDASVFPAAPFLISIDDEIIKVNTVLNNLLSVTRAQEGTTAAAHAKGVSVENRMTAGMYNALATQEEVDEHKADAVKHITSAERARWNAKQDALGYTPVDKAGDSITGDLKVNGNIVAGKELVVGYDGTTESLQRHKWKYNASTGYLELWRYTNQNKWELSATFPNRNTGEGGLVVEGKQMATEDYVNNKVKTDVPANAKFTDKRTARFVVGTSTAGWTSADCDYLCDGTNDQEEIIQALNDLPATGGEVVILDGTYNITASINIPKDNVFLRGNGNATILKRMYDSTSANSGSTARGLITLNGKSGCKIQGLQIDGNKATYTADYNYGIYLNSSSNNMVTGNICNNSNNGIRFDSSSNKNIVTDNTCNSNSNGIRFDSSSSDNTITGNTCNNNGNGIYLYSSSNNTVTGNTCNNNYYGIFLYSSSDNTVTGNTCNSNNNGIRLYLSSNNNTVTGNTCNNNSDSGIYLNSSSNNTVTGNTCNNNYYGIYLSSSSSDNTITGNTCNNNYYGISLSSSSSDNTVTGNTCNSNSNGIYLNSSSNNTVTGNTCNSNSNGIYLYSSSNNTVTGNICIRGTGQTSDYTSYQYTIRLRGTASNYNLISSNNCMGKAVVIESGTGNSAWGNKFDDTDDLP